MKEEMEIHITRLEGVEDNALIFFYHFLYQAKLYFLFVIIKKNYSPFTISLFFLNSYIITSKGINNGSSKRLQGSIPTKNFLPLPTTRVVYSRSTSSEETCNMLQIRGENDTMEKGQHSS